MRLVLPTATTETAFQALVDAALLDINRTYTNNRVRATVSLRSPRIALVVLRCDNSRYGPARMSASGRRTNSANWEAHRMFMHHLFTSRPDAKLYTALANYYGKADFEAKHGATYHHNAGSKMQPASFGSL